MRNKAFFFAAALILVLFSTTWSAPQQVQQGYPNGRPASPSGDDLTSVLRQLRNNVSDLQHEMRNHESEITVFENKIASQESAFEHLRQQLSEEVQSQKDYVRASSINIDGKIETLDQSIKNLDNLLRGLTADLRLLKTQANDSVAVLAQYKEKIGELENLVQTQSQHMQNLQSAMQSMMEVWQAKEAAKAIASKPLESDSSGARTYKVQPGDSLGKIAIEHKVTLQALKDANQLANDRIIVGQTLKIP